MKEALTTLLNEELDLEGEQVAGIVSLLELRDAAAQAPPSAPQRILPKTESSEKVAISKATSVVSSPAAATALPTINEKVAQPPSGPTATSEEIALLASLCPFEVPSEFLEDLLIKECSGNLQSAANRILELEQFPERWKIDIASWEKDKTKKRDTISNKQRTKTAPDGSPLRPDEELRRSIVSRFHLEALPLETDGGGFVGKGKGASIAAWGTQHKGGKDSSAKSAAQMRYREGVVVSTRGDKYIVEKPPEWDGGSRGKVKSKRKGGVGWQ